MKMTRTSFGIVLCLSITAFGLTPVSYVMASNDKTSIEEVKKETGFSNAYSDLEKAWEKAEVEFTPEKDQKTP